MPIDISHQNIHYRHSMVEVFLSRLYVSFAVSCVHQPVINFSTEFEY